MFLISCDDENMHARIVAVAQRDGNLKINCFIIIYFFNNNIRVIVLPFQFFINKVV